MDSGLRTAEVAAWTTLRVGTNVRFRGLSRGSIQASVLEFYSCIVNLLFPWREEQGVIGHFACAISRYELEKFSQVPCE